MGKLYNVSSFGVYVKMEILIVIVYKVLWGLNEVIDVIFLLIYRVYSRFFINFIYNVVDEDGIVCLKN